MLSSDIVVAFPGGAGTASEVSLALQYNRPLVAFIEQEGDIPNLSKSVSRMSTLEEIQTFIESFLHTFSET